MSTISPTASPVAFAARGTDLEGTEKAPISSDQPVWVKASIGVGAVGLALATAAAGYCFWKKVLKRRQDLSPDAEATRPNGQDHNPVSMHSRRDSIMASEPQARAIPIKKIPIITISRPSVEVPGEGVEISNEGIDISGNSQGGDYRGVQGRMNGESQRLPEAVASAVRLTINTNTGGVSVGEVGESGDTWTSAVLMTPKENTIANRDGTRSPVTPVAIARRVVSMDTEAKKGQQPKPSPKTRVQVESIEIKEDGGKSEEATEKAPANEEGEKNPEES